MNDIDRLLREDARAALPDEGFSARVLVALPPPAAMAHPWLRPAIVMGSTALGAFLAAAFAPAGTALLEGFADLLLLRGLTPAALTGLSMAGALLACAIVLAVEAE